MASADKKTSAYLVAFGQAIRQTREKQGLSQEDLSFESGLDRTYISGVERAVRNPTVKTVLRICQALGTKPSTLMRRAEDYADQ